MTAALLTFLAEAFVISLSGSLAPGPITAIAVGRGSRARHAGAWVAIGHALVEIPLMIAVFAGMARILHVPAVRSLITGLGAIVLLQMGVSMVRLARRSDVACGRDAERSPVLSGVWLSLTSPYFLLWWATVGSTLISRAAAFGLGGFVAFAAVHWDSDLGWCEFLSNLSFLGGRFFGSRFQQAVFAICGVLLCVFGVRLLVDVSARLLA